MPEARLTLPSLHQSQGRDLTSSGQRRLITSKRSQPLTVSTNACRRGCGADQSAPGESSAGQAGVIRAGVASRSCDEPPVSQGRQGESDPRDTLQRHEGPRHRRGRLHRLASRRRAAGRRTRVRVLDSLDPQVHGGPRRATSIPAPSWSRRRARPRGRRAGARRRRAARPPRGRRGRRASRCTRSSATRR